MSLVYPRIPTAEAVRLAEPMIAGEITELEAAQLAKVRHPRAAPVATGGTPVDEGHLQGVREAVKEELASLGRRASTASIDLVVGRVLHEKLGINRADAGSNEVWSFITLVLLPDVALKRFPHPTRDRLVGAGPRSALRRVWHRQDVLGDLLTEGPSRLSEDELVGLTERTSMVRNRPLARSIARQVIIREDREEAWARDFYRLVRWKTGPLLLDVLQPSTLEEVVADIALRVDREHGRGVPTNGRDRSAKSIQVVESGQDASMSTRFVVPRGRGSSALRRPIDIVVTTDVVLQYASAHGVDRSSAEDELRLMIQDFSKSSETWVNKEGQRSFRHDGYLLRTSPDGRSFVHYSAGRDERWGHYRMYGQSAHQS